ncbi:MAG: hypothetical protein HZR80_09015 [Candidatus Heimdallarchaeota archaeon]
MLFNNPLNYVNIITGFIAIAVSFLILVKDIKAFLNILFSSALSFWGLSLLLNGLTFLYTEPTVGANLIRDFVTGTASVAAFLIFATAFSMFHGEHYLKKWYLFLPFIACVLVNTIVGSYFDSVVWDSEDGLPTTEGIKTTQEPWVMIFIYLIPTIVICFAIFFFIRTRKEVEDPLIKRRILYFILGFTFIVAGVLTYALSGIYEQIFSQESVTFEYIGWIVAEIYWIIGPVLMFVGFNIGKIGKRDREVGDIS